MKSRTSFFNKAVYKKNMALYWPIWVCYLLYGLVKVPGVLWFHLRQSNITESLKKASVGDCLNLEIDIYVIAVMAVIVGMAVFGYLFTAKSTNMIHALPVTRAELFVTNAVSGLSFMIIPQIVVFLVTVVTFLGNEISCVEYVMMWLLSVMGISFFLFSLVCLCAMLTGLLFALPVYFAVINYLTVGLSVGVRYVIAFLGYGVSYGDTPDIFFLRILSPLNYLHNNVRLSAASYYDEEGKLVTTALHYVGGRVVLGYVLAAFAIYLLAFYCYQKRRSESAGDLLTFKWLKPVFRWGVGVSAGYAAGIFAASFLEIILIWVSRPILLLLVMALGVLGFFIADMFVQKSFRVFCKGRWKECGLFLVFSAACFGGIYGTACYMENYIPREETISAAYISMNYPVEFEGQESATVIAVQEEILGKKRVFQKLCTDAQDYTYITCTYRFKNGKYMERSYMIPAGAAESQELADTIYGYEAEPQNFLRYLVGYDYEQITQVTEAQLEGYADGEIYITQYLNGDGAVRLFHAVYDDAMEGTLQKYNLENYLKEDSGITENETAVYLQFSFNHASEDWQDVFQRVNGESYSDYEEMEKTRSDYLYLRLGEDCTNLIDALIQEGMIASKEDLHFSKDFVD